MSKSRSDNTEPVDPGSRHSHPPQAAGSLQWRGSHGTATLSFCFWVFPSWLLHYPTLSVPGVLWSLCFCFQSSESSHCICKHATDPGRHREAAVSLLILTASMGQRSILRSVMQVPPGNAMTLLLCARLCAGLVVVAVPSSEPSPRGHVNWLSLPHALTAGALCVPWPWFRN